MIAQIVIALFIFKVLNFLVNYFLKKLKGKINGLAIGNSFLRGIKDEIVNEL